MLSPQSFDEVEVESVVLAQETPEEVRALFSSPTTYVDHEALKRLIPEASFVIRTGEATSLRQRDRQKWGAVLK